MSDDEITLFEDLRELAPVEEGKLGHHTVLNAGGARVVVLAFEAGHVLKEHRAPCPVLLQAIDGRLRVTAGDQIADLRPGGLLYLPASAPHAVEALAPSRLSLTLIGI
ncbi:hypothetical protein C9F11_01420 [Streptomyces sp. YIM 121038]|uniref:cupin domain-containing protein n=1 Tax=Streptomyces sp. YIM 121038 TaxID=2136401 RepID=UPI001110665D|nr:cupin domain-containing protein [Streptomyces sp. YIM 121038]QCX73987.1 hypothetical protein C9F11_01420 [Streptomyces sp. YIM 121038]